MTQQKKRLAYGIGLSLILPLLSACASASPGSFCLIYQPVYTATSDTEQTKKQVDENNAVWLDLCANE